MIRPQLSVSALPSCLGVVLVTAGPECQSSTRVYKCLLDVTARGGDGHAARVLCFQSWLIRMRQKAPCCKVSERHLPCTHVLSAMHAASHVVLWFKGRGRLHVLLAPQMPVTARPKPGARHRASGTPSGPWAGLSASRLHEQGAESEVEQLAPHTRLPDRQYLKVLTPRGQFFHFLLKFTY